MTSHAVVGLGEVGSALAQLLPDPFTYDVRDGAFPEDAPTVEMLHVAFPWSESFVEDVQRYERALRPAYVVVHSTVPVGTCGPHGWVHTPVRGRHPDLVDGLKTFTKHVGGAAAGHVARALAFDAGLTCQIHDQARTTEAGKLWELAQFGLQVAIEKAIHAWCEERGISPDEVYAAFAFTYNDGYRALGEERFLRPVLRHMPGPIGGHCVQAGVDMLDYPLSVRVLRMTGLL